MNEADVNEIVAPDAQEPVTVRPEIETEIRPPRSAVNEVEPPPIEAVALSQIVLKFEPVDGGTPVIAAVPNERGATFAAGAGATGEFRLTIWGSALGAGFVVAGAAVSTAAACTFAFPASESAGETVGARPLALALIVLVVVFEPSVALTVGAIGGGLEPPSVTALTGWDVDER